MLTKADEGGRGGKLNADHCWQRGEGGVGTPVFGWRNMWTAPNYNKSELLQILLRGEKPEIYEKYSHNKLIFKYVQDFLIKTKRLVFKSKNQYIPT